MDLAGRKLSIDGGTHWKRFLTEMADYAGELPDNDEFSIIKNNLSRVVVLTQECAEWIVGQHNTSLRQCHGRVCSFLKINEHGNGLLYDGKKGRLRREIN